MNYFFIINIAFVGLFLLGAMYFWSKANKLKKHSNKEAGDGASDGFTLLAISVTKNNDRTPLAAEQMFAALHGIFREDSTLSGPD